MESRTEIEKRFTVWKKRDRARVLGAHTETNEGGEAPLDERAEAERRVDGELNLEPERAIAGVLLILEL